MRDDLLDAAEQMVQERGLNAVSFQHLAEAVGLSKPSVFHHFPSKEALARALVERCRTKNGDQYDEVIERDLPAPEKLRAIAAVFQAGLIDGRPCLLGALGSSVATLPETVSNDLRRAVGAAIDRIAHVFEQGRREDSLAYAGAPGDAATAFLAMLEGLQMLARAKQDRQAFAPAASAYIESIMSEPS